MRRSGGQQIEFDVFPKDPKGDYSYLADIKKDAPSGHSSVTVALPQQSVIILTLCVVMLLVVSFALGVERGKLVAKGTPKAPGAPWERSAILPADTGTRTSLKKPKQEQIKTAVAQAKEAETGALKQEKTPPAGNYVIQVASFRTKETASRLVETLVKEGWPSFTKTSGDYEVVLAGSYAKKEEAESKIGRLQKKFTDCFVKPI